MANIENKENTNNPISKTTETLIKELETMREDNCVGSCSEYWKD